MNFEQLINRISQNKLTERKIGNLRVGEIPEGTPIDHVIELVSFARVAQKYRDAYENGDDIPEDLTDEIFEQIKINKEEFDRMPGAPK